MSFDLLGWFFFFFVSCLSIQWPWLLVIWIGCFSMGLQVLMGLEMALDNWYLFSIPKLVINYNNYVCSLHLFYLSLSLPHSNFIFLFSVVGCFSPCLFSKFDLITKFDAYWLVASALFKSLIFFFFLYDIANSNLLDVGLVWKFSIWIFLFITHNVFTPYSALLLELLLCCQGIPLAIS